MNSKRSVEIGTEKKVMMHNLKTFMRTLGILTREVGVTEVLETITLCLREMCA